MSTPFKKSPRALVRKAGARIEALFARIPRSVRKRAGMIAVAGAFVLVVFYTAILAPPRDFPEKMSIKVDQGDTLLAIAERFEERQIVRSEFWLRMFVTAFGGERDVQAGDYYFDEPESMLMVAHMLRTGDFGLEPIFVTVPEGSSVFDIAQVLAADFENIGVEEFVTKAAEYEGYLFPDTYHFLPNATSDAVIKKMRGTFDEKIAEIRTEIRAFNEPLERIVTMASILEKEAHTFASKRIISDILWSRITIGMPLQVDAVFPYINGKNTFELTLDDLQHESPYNTYRYPDLPPGPIANPGLDSIRAAVTPEQNAYLYYLSDYDGNLYYSETFEEHKRKKAKYLN